MFAIATVLPVAATLLDDVAVSVAIAVAIAVAVAVAYFYSTAPEIAAIAAALVASDFAELLLGHSDGGNYHCHYHQQHLQLLQLRMQHQQPL